MSDSPTAEIKVFATTSRLHVVGLADDETVSVPPGSGLALSVDAAGEVEPGEIFISKPIKGGVIANVRAPEEAEPFGEERLEQVPAGEPLVYVLSDATTIDLTHFRPAAAQAAASDRPLMIVSGRVRDVGS